MRSFGGARAAVQAVTVALEIVPRGRNNGCMTVGADFECGKALLNDGRSFEALPFIERAYAEEPLNPEYQSYYGLVMALERGQVRLSIDLCREAVDRARERPELYLNLARVHLKAGRKADAFDALQDGLRCDPQNEGLKALAAGFGTRRPPFFRNLPRGHVLNKYLGRLASMLRPRRGP